jgi:predicted nucleotidyltransferase
VFKLDYRSLMERVRRYAEDLVNSGRAELVVLFGSLAEGRYLPSSDIDLLIVVREAPANPLERISAYIDPKLPLDLEPRVFTVEEFFRLARERRRFALEVLTKGVLLAGRKEVLEEARKVAGLQPSCS